MVLKGVCKCKSMCGKEKSDCERQRFVLLSQNKKKKQKQKQSTQKKDRCVYMKKKSRA